MLPVMMHFEMITPIMYRVRMMMAKIYAFLPDTNSAISPISIGSSI
jgi:hypothetical protein